MNYLNDFNEFLNDIKSEPLRRKEYAVNAYFSAKRKCVFLMMGVALACVVALLARALIF